MSQVDLVVNDNKKESYVGKKLNDSTTKKVIILVLVLIFSFPILTVNSYIRLPLSYDTGLDLLLLLKSTGSSFENKKYLFTQIVQMESELYTPLIYLKITLDGHDPLVWQS